MICILKHKYVIILLNNKWNWSLVCVLFVERNKTFFRCWKKVLERVEQSLSDLYWYYNTENHLRKDGPLCFPLGFCPDPTSVDAGPHLRKTILSFVFLTTSQFSTSMTTHKVRFAFLLGAFVWSSCFLNCAEEKQNLKIDFN